MNIILLGATGMAGAAILQEAISRGHHVTAAARHPRPTTNPLITPVVIDLEHPGLPLAQALEGADAVVLTIRMPPGDDARLGPLTARVLDQAGNANVRTLIVGGAAPLRSPHDPQTLVLDDPAYVPTQWRDVAAASLEQFDVCAGHPNRNWIYLSPSAVFEPGIGVGAYRRGADTLLLNPDGTSRVTPPDLALAVLDELEHPSFQHHFTVIEQDSCTDRRR